MLASTIVPYIIMLTVYWKTNFLGEIFLFLPFFFFKEYYFPSRRLILTTDLPQESSFTPEKLLYNILSSDLSSQTNPTGERAFPCCFPRRWLERLTFAHHQTSAKQLKWCLLYFSVRYFFFCNVSHVLSTPEL